MSLPTRPVTIRLSNESTRRLGLLCGEFAGLRQAQVLRLLLDSLLSRPIDEQVRAVQEQIRTGHQHEPAADAPPRP